MACHTCGAAGRWCRCQRGAVIAASCPLTLTAALLLPAHPHRCPPLLRQEYILSPLTIDSYKFHFRYYAVLRHDVQRSAEQRGMSPREHLQLRVFPVALVFFATEPFSEIEPRWSVKRAHITNSAVNSAVKGYCTQRPWSLRTLAQAARIPSAPHHPSRLYRTPPPSHPDAITSRPAPPPTPSHPYPAPPRI